MPKSAEPTRTPSSSTPRHVPIPEEMPEPPETPAKKLDPIEELKEWVRREIHLFAINVTESERREQNP